MTTQILERPEVKESDTGPEMFHYVRKEKIAESAVMGTFVIALCGEKFPVTKRPSRARRCVPRAKRSTTRCRTDQRPPDRAGSSGDGTCL